MATKIKSKKMNENEIKSSPIEVQGLASISKSVKESVVNINSRDELRFLVDQYYQAQNYRIAADGQIRAINQMFDTSDDGKLPDALLWVSKNIGNQETQIKHMLDEYTSSTKIGRWLKSTIGIGPCISAGLIAYLDVSKCNHASQFMSYAGLNDNNCPWLGKTKGEEVVKTAIANCGLSKVKNSTTIPEEVILECARLTKRSPLSISRNSTNPETGLVDKEHLLKYLKMPPYNTKLKVLCFKIGESFCKMSNKEDSLYGRIYRERKLYEMDLNEKGQYKDQAEAALRNKNYSKSTSAYKAYSQGKLPDAHIVRRAERYATKLFLSHVFEAMYIDYYHKLPPEPYVIAHKGHVDYIGPEIPYSEYWNFEDR